MAVETKAQPTSKPEQVCFWCEQKGHTHKSADKTKWTCPEYLVGKEPSAFWEAQCIKKGYPPILLNEL